MKKKRKKKTNLQKQWTEIKQKIDNLIQEIELVNIEKIAYHAQEINKLCAQRNKLLNKTNGHCHKKKGQKRKDT